MTAGLHVDEQLGDLDGLSGAELVGCTITGVVAEAAQLHGMRLEGCTFVDCQLRLATVTDTRLGDTTFLRCNLTGIDWTAASWSAFAIAQGLRFIESTLDYGTFHGLSLQGLCLYACRAVDVDLAGCDLSDADLRFTDLTDARLDQSILTGARLGGAVGYHFDPRTVRAGGCEVSMPEAARLLAHLGFDVVASELPQPAEEAFRR